MFMLATRLEYVI